MGCDNNGVISLENIIYDGSTISWDKVTNATSYNLTINDQNFVIYNNKIDFITKDKNFTLKLYAILDNGSKITEVVEKTFIKLDDVEKIEIDNSGIISWNKVNNSAL